MLFKHFLTLAILWILVGCQHREDPWSGHSIKTAIGQGTYNERGQYLIYPGDVIQIYVHANPQLSGSYRVSTSGFITVPKIGLVRAAGRNDILLQTAISLKLRPIIKNARVHVTVSEINSYKVIISGKIQKPGLYDLKRRTTLTEIIGMAGGITPESSPERIVLVRKGPKGNKIRYSVDYDDFERGDLIDVDNFWIERGDLVHLY